MKICSKNSGCGKEKPLNKFSKKSRNKSGYAAICLECDRLKSKAYKDSNKEKIKESSARYKSNNKEKIKESSARYRENNKEEINKRGREFYNNNIETEKERNRKYRANNPEKERERRRRRRARKKKVNENYTKTDEKITYKVFGKECFYCKSKDSLTIDHHYCLNDNNPLTISNAVILCRSCNSSKGIKKPEEFYTVSQLNNLDKLFAKAVHIGYSK